MGQIAMFVIEIEILARARAPPSRVALRSGVLPQHVRAATIATFQVTCPCQGELNGPVLCSWNFWVPLGGAWGPVTLAMKRGAGRLASRFSVRRHLIQQKR
jgi:hypothetical protein